MSPAPSNIPRNDRAARLAALRKIARGHGGRCLADEYVNLRVALEFECAEGHRFSVLPEKVFAGRWCSQCRLRGPDRLKEIQDIAAAHGGTCLSREYHPGREKMKFRCAEGHEWETACEQVRRGRWCPRCAGKGTTIEDLRRLAAEHGGRCVSRQYRHSRQPLTWECAKGHRFSLLLLSVEKGGWCPTCRGEAGSLGKALKIAAEKGGMLVSTRGLRATARLRWRCAKGHEWMSSAAWIATGRRWCQECQRLGIDAMRELAAERGGRCLSTEYVNVDSKLLWECAAGHRWWAMPGNVKYRGSWCPECAKQTRRSDAKDRR